jgi:hypothetical protein
VEESDGKTENPPNMLALGRLTVNGTEDRLRRSSVWARWRITALTCAFAVERVTGIEPALSARESVASGPVTGPDLRGGLSRVTVRDRPSPGLMTRKWPGDLGLRTGVSRVGMPRAPPTSPTRGDDACHGPLLSNGTTRRCRHGAGIE